MTTPSPSSGTSPTIVRPSGERDTVCQARTESGRVSTESFRSIQASVVFSFSSFPARYTRTPDCENVKGDCPGSNPVVSPSSTRASAPVTFKLDRSNGTAYNPPPRRYTKCPVGTYRGVDPQTCNTR